MKITTKTILAGAAIAGILTGASASAFAKVDNAKKSGTQLNTMSDKSSCKGKDGCKGTNGCKGHNTCKGKGGCKSGDNGCKGKNSCKGKGGCATNGSK